jgi:hypothetical protein
MDYREALMKSMMIHAAVCCALLFSLPVTGNSAGWSQPDNYTATMVSQGHSMPMARMGAKSRMENIGQQGLVTIGLPEMKKTIMMSTVNKTYAEQPARESQPTLYDPDVVYEQKKVGSETVDGHPCIKYDVVFYRKSAPERKHKGTVWEAQDLKNLHIRQEFITSGDPRNPGSGGKVVVELKDVKLGGAKASMFEVPSDYRQVNSAAEVMGMGNMDEMMRQMKKKR